MRVTLKSHLLYFVFTMKNSYVHKLTLGVLTKTVMNTKSNKSTGKVSSLMFFQESMSDPSLKGIL